MDRVKVNNDQEPWISGRAEFYGMALGQGKDGKARVDMVQMPYLDYDDTTYFPNQIIVDWSHYKWNAVDFMFMEHDDNSNYATIAITIANAIAPFTGGAEYVAAGDQGPGGPAGQLVHQRRRLRRLALLPHP